MGWVAASQQQKIHIETLLKDGQTQRVVASKVSISYSCAKNVAKRIKGGRLLTNAPGQGRQHASTERDDRQLLQLCKRDGTKSSRPLSSEWVLSNGKTITACTVRRQLLQTGYKSYIAKRKPCRSAVQEWKRLKFANNYIHWLPEDWQSIIWSDEANFELLNRKNRTFVRPTMNETDKSFSFVARM